MDPKTWWKSLNTSIHVFIHIYWIAASIFNKGRQPTNPQKLKLKNSYIMKILPIIGKLKVCRTHDFVLFCTYFLRFPSVNGLLSLQFPYYHHTLGPLLLGTPLFSLLEYKNPIFHTHLCFLSWITTLGFL